MGEQPIARPLLTQDSTTHKDEDKHPFFERDLNRRSQYPSDQDYALDRGNSEISSLNFNDKYAVASKPVIIGLVLVLRIRF
jgi:hypothetical protein